MEDDYEYEGGREHTRHAARKAHTHTAAKHKKKHKSAAKGGSKKVVTVKGYRKADGTRVKGYTRTVRK